MNQIALFKDKPEFGATLKKTSIPEPKENEVLIKIKVASICGTDVHIYKYDQWAQNRLKLPLIFGHEFAGEVIELGKNAELFNDVKEHDIVSGETHIACNKCFQCKTGNKHICENVKILGVDTNGSYAEYAVIPAENAWVNDKSVPLHWMSVQEPLGNAVHTIFSSPKSVSGNTVFIAGAGPIGLCASALCKALGATKVFISDVNDFRLNLAKKMNADYTINSKEENVVEFIKKNTSNKGVDVFLEMSGNEQALNEGLKALRAGGAASILGVFGKPVTINMSEDIVFKYLSIQGINGRLMFNTWYYVKEILKNKLINLDPIITHKFSLKDYEKAFDLMISGNSGKILFPF